MTDKYDEQAKELCDELGLLFGAAETVFAAALRKAAEDEREACAKWLDERAEKGRSHRCPQYESCFYCAKVEAWDFAADEIRSRRKAGGV